MSIYVYVNCQGGWGYVYVIIVTSMPQKPEISDGINQD